MPTPAGHLLTSLAAWTAFRPWSLAMIRSPWLWLLVISANAPDLDFLPGLLVGDEGRFHHGVGHSVGAAALYGLLVLAAARAVTGGTRAALFALAAFALFGSHLILDLFVRDTGAPYGLQLLWPFSDAYLTGGAVLFPNLERHPFDLSVVGRALPVVAAELLILGPLVAAAELLRRRRSGGTS